MSIPGALMPGGGGPPAGPMDAGGGGGDAGGMGGMGDILKLLAGLQQQPSPDAEKKMIQEAATLLAGSYQKLQLRSPKAARMVSEAQAKLQGAIEAMQQEGQRGLSSPPDLGMSGAPSGGGGMGMMGGM